MEGLSVGTAIGGYGVEVAIAFVGRNVVIADTVNGCGTIRRKVKEADAAELPKFFQREAVGCFFLGGEIYEKKKGKKGQEISFHGLCFLLSWR
ncbi:MAG: hypothetical protein ACE5FF_17860 [Saprospiraceae bacterium]